MILAKMIDNIALGLHDIQVSLNLLARFIMGNRIVLYFHFVGWGRGCEIK